MSERKAISMGPVKEKLRSLGDYVKEDDTYLKELCNDFGEYVAKRLENHPQLVPGGFGLALFSAIDELERGVDRFGEPIINNRLTKQRPFVYTALQLMIPEIAAATCPKDFADKVKKDYEEIRESMEKKQSKKKQNTPS